MNELVRGKRAITPDTALRLALLFHLEPAFWLGLQMQWDIYRECMAAVNPTATPQLSGSRRADR